MKNRGVYLVDYTEKLYLPLCNLHNKYYKDLENVMRYHEWKSSVSNEWNKIKITQGNNIKDISIKNLYENDKEELEKYRDITLPMFKNKIVDAKAKSYEQFKEDLLSKLKASIESVSEQIDTLNTSLANFKFGRDRYEFIVRANPTYMNIYTMIMDELLMKDARINSQAFYEKYKETIDDFFAKLTEAPGANDEERRAIIDKNISLYTDYRTFLDFDFL